MKVLAVLFLLLGSFFDVSSSYKVLVFNPAFGASHSNFLGKISDILTDAGHDVTMFIPVFMNSKKHLIGSKKVKNIVRIEQDPRVKQLHEISKTEEIMKKDIWRMNSDITAMLSMATNFTLSCGYMCEHMFQQTDVIESLKNEQFDLGISESLFVCGHALFDHIGVKSVINADSILMMDAVKYALGEPSSTSFYPGVFVPMTDQMDFLGRLRNLAGFLVSMWFTVPRYVMELELIKPYYNGKRTHEEHLSSIAFNMINSNQYLDYPSAVLPKTVFIGGMQVNTKKNGKVKLSQEWEDVLNKRKRTVLVSFGSNAFSSDMPDEFKSAFLDVFESMPDVTFIWKYEIENSTIAEHLPNVKLSTWMPQNDLLADERLSMFVTHGGLGSTMELAYQGKPALVIPLMADQPRNAHMLTRHGGALQFEKSRLSNSADLKKAIETVLNDNNYAKSALKLAQILESQPNQPKDVVLKHCDFAVKVGPLETLNSSGRHLNILQYYSIDILFVSFLLLSSVVIVVFVLLRAIVNRCLKISTKSKKD